MHLEAEVIFILSYRIKGTTVSEIVSLKAKCFTFLLSGKKMFLILPLKRWYEIEYIFTET